MTVRLATDGAIELSDSCPLEDAEILQQHLLAAPGSVVDWRACQQAHTAVIQVLLASRVTLHGPPAGDLLRLQFDVLMKPPPA